MAKMMKKLLEEVTYFILRKQCQILGDLRQLVITYYKFKCSIWQIIHIWQYSLT